MTLNLNCFVSKKKNGAMNNFNVFFLVVRTNINYVYACVAYAEFLKFKLISCELPHDR